MGGTCSCAASTSVPPGICSSPTRTPPCTCCRRITRFHSVSNNFFPVDSSMYVRENGTDGRQLVISTDRAQGGSSLSNGQLVLMVCRHITTALQVTHGLQ